MVVGSVVFYQAPNGAQAPEVVVPALVVHVAGAEGAERLNLLYVDASSGPVGSLGADVRAVKGVRRADVPAVAGERDNGSWRAAVVS